MLPPCFGSDYLCDFQLEKCNRAEAVPDAGGAPAVDFGDIVVYTTVEPDVLCWVCCSPPADWLNNWFVRVQS